jgi:periplasmic protein TonB
MSTATEVRGPQVETPVPAADLETLALPQVRAPQLFHDVLLESSGGQRKRRRFAAVLSFAFQCLVLGVLLVVPLMYTDVLPPGQLLTFLEAPPPPPPPPPAASAEVAKVVRRVESEIQNGGLRAPTKIPKTIQMIKEDEAPPEIGGGVPGGVPGGIPGGQVGGVIGGILSSTANSAAIPKLALPAPPKRIRVSQGVTEGQLMQKVQPLYPAIALAARVQGTVLLKAIISKNGEIENLELVSGHPMLIQAAIAAVKQWRYRPFLLNGEPVEVETTINVNFQLN